MTLTAPATATGSTLVMVDRHQAGDWQQALASLGRRLPVGWDASGERIGGVAGYDLILAVPRTLSALAWFLMSAGEDELADPILQAHHDALTAVAVEFGCAIGAEAPSMVGHAYNSARQPWSHAHLVYGALVATNHGFIPLNPAGSPSRLSGTSSATSCWCAARSPSWSAPSSAWAGRRRPRMGPVR